MKSVSATGFLDLRLPTKRVSSFIINLASSSWPNRTRYSANGAMRNYPPSIQKLINQFIQLPGIGPKTAERLVFSLLYQPQSFLTEFGTSLAQLKDKILRCGQCQNFSETDPCEICANPQRNKKVVCVVGRPQDMVALEKIGEYEGVYHILGGVIDPLEGVTPDKLTIKVLLERIKANNVSEIILGLNPDMPGETTMIYLTKLLKQLTGLKLTRLARGLPVGSDLEYADEVTLSSALKGRREL